MLSRIVFVLLVFFACMLDACGPMWGNMRPLEPARYTQIQQYAGTPRKIIPVVVDKNFSTEDQKSIDDSISAWNYVLNGYLVMKVESWAFDMEIPVLKSVISRHGLVIMKVDSSSPLIPEKAKGKGMTLAWANDIGGTKIWAIRDRFETPDLFPIMLHELGHILGAGHEEDKPEFSGYLMYPHYSRGTYNCVDGRAMKKVAEFQMLIPDRLNYCY